MYHIRRRWLAAAFLFLWLVAGTLWSTWRWDSAEPAAKKPPAAVINTYVPTEADKERHRKIEAAISGLEREGVTRDQLKDFILDEVQNEAFDGLDDR